MMYGINQDDTTRPYFRPQSQHQKNLDGRESGIQQGGSGRARLRDGEGDTVMTGGSNADAFVVTVGQDLMTDFS